MMKASDGAMTQIGIFLCVCMCMAFAGPGCGPDHGSSGDVGAAAFTLNWPDGGITANAPPSPANRDSVAGAAPAPAQGPVSDHCAQLGIATVAAEVRDGSGMLLASDVFDCDAGEGVIEDIPVGSQRRFVLTGLDAGGRERYHGEMSGVTISTGLNQVGTIDMELMNVPPAAEITSPEDGTVFPTGSSVAFSGTGTDAEDGILSGAALVWTSDKDGAIGTGGAFTTRTLSPGGHEITLTVTDTHGDTDAQTISIRLNSLPAALITGPADDEVFDSGSPVVFSGTGTDAEDGTLSGSALVWTSDKDGPIGTGASVSVNSLSTGAHEITLTATDTCGDADVKTVSIRINAIPAAVITGPSDGGAYITGNTVIFTGTGTDAEDGTLSGSALEWTSSLDGNIGTGVTAATADLSEGTHTITLTATDTDGASGSDSITLVIEKALLPDTGQVKSFTDTFGEDADYMINPPSYTKLDAKGDPLPLTAASWAMVRDNLTGLVWEVKTDDGSIHDGEDLYTWQNAKDVFVRDLNQAGFGGQSDWRLPTVLELSTLVYAGNSELAINPVYFPHTQGCVECPAYWSATGYDKGYAWIVDFSTGDVRTRDRSSTGWVRAVRGGVFETGRFIDNTDGTVTDSATDLMWQKNTAGSRTWEEAIAYCEDLEIAGFSDWRLPSRHELQSIVDYTRHSPAISEKDFPETQQAYYWTSTTRPGYDYYAHVIDFITGRVDTVYKLDTYSVPFVRAVRGGSQSLVPRAAIRQPMDEGVYRPDMTIAFSGEGEDARGKALSGKSLLWTSDAGGIIGTGADISAKLSPGFHTIALTALDSLGGTAHDILNIYVSPVTETTEPVTGMTFVLVPAGCYQMGCDGLAPDCESDELPLHEVCLNAFWLGKYEVTQGEWLQIRKTMPFMDYYCGQDCPAENVSWTDIQTFISSMNGVAAYTHMVRIPTEAQWEYAAGSAGEADLYAGGSSIDAVAWYSGNSDASIHAVGGKSQNALGLHDMSGNVREWCYDWYGAYPSEARFNPMGPDKGRYRVVRGGGFDDEESACRCTNRSWLAPGSRDQRTGFRLAVDYNLYYRDSY